MFARQPVLIDMTPYLPKEDTVFGAIDDVEAEQIAEIEQAAAEVAAEEEQAGRDADGIRAMITADLPAGAADRLAAAFGAGDVEVADGEKAGTDAAAEYRAKASEARAARAESFQSSGNDGFLSQWAHQTLETEYLAKADLVDAGGMAEFPALFDLDGALLHALPVTSKFGGERWKLAGGEFLSTSRAQDPKRAATANAKKGVYVGRISAPAVVRMEGTGARYANLVRANRDDWTGVVVVDNGK